VRSRLLFFISCICAASAGYATELDGKGHAESGGNALFGISVSGDGEANWQGLQAGSDRQSSVKSAGSIPRADQRSYSPPPRSRKKIRLRLGGEPSATAVSPPSESPPESGWSAPERNVPDEGLAGHSGRGPAGGGKARVSAPPAGAASSELEQLKRALAEQQRMFQEQQRKLQDLQARIERLAGGAPAAPPVQTGAAGQPGTVVAANSGAQGVPASAPLPKKPVGQMPETTQKPKVPELPRISETVGGVLTPKGRLMLEPSAEYAYTGNNRVFLDAFTFLPAIAIGLIDLRQIQRHTFIGAGTARFGITDSLEISGRVPFLYRQDKQRSRPVAIGAGIDETFEADGSGLGDIEFTGRYQLNGGGGGWPVFVANLTTSIPTGKSPYDIRYVTAQGVPGAVFPTELPTGVGYFSFQPSVTALYPTDPAVFFGSLSYGFNAETSEKIGKVDPGDSVGGSFGLGFSINERASFSIGYSHKHVFDTDLNGKTVEGSDLNIGEFLLGYAYKLTQDVSVNLSLNLGATSDAQDVKMTLRVPTYFQAL
jgi:hypothetical protein